MNKIVKYLILPLAAAILAGIFMYHYENIWFMVRGYDSKNDGLFSATLTLPNTRGLDPEIISQIKYYPCTLDICHEGGPAIEKLSVTLKSSNELQEIEALQGDDSETHSLSTDSKTMTVNIQSLRKGSTIKYKLKSLGTPHFDKKIVVAKGHEISKEDNKAASPVNVLMKQLYFILITIWSLLIGLIILLKYNYKFAWSFAGLVNRMRNAFSISQLEYLYRNPDLNLKPALISSSMKDSHLIFNASVLKWRKGTISTFVYVDAPGCGILNMRNNRYIVGHFKNNGIPADGKSTYANAFGLSRSPKSSKNQKPCWRLWTSNSAANNLYLECEDDIATAEGWHHFVIRWDRAKPILELVIDDKTVLSSSDFEGKWPQEFSEIFIGTWPNLASIHYIDTSVYRTFFMDTFIDDRWIKYEYETHHKTKRPEIR